MITQIGTVVKWNQMHVYLTTKFDLDIKGPELNVSVLAEIFLPNKHRFIKLVLFKYKRAGGDFRAFLQKCKLDAIHDLKNELLVSAFGHEVRVAHLHYETKLAHLQLEHTKARRELAQGIIDG